MREKEERHESPCSESEGGLLRPWQRHLRMYSVCLIQPLASTGDNAACRETVYYGLLQCKKAKSTLSEKNAVVI